MSNWPTFWPELQSLQDSGALETLGINILLYDGYTGRIQCMVGSSAPKLVLLLGIKDNHYDTLALQDASGSPLLTVFQDITVLPASVRALFEHNGVLPFPEASLFFAADAHLRVCSHCDRRNNRALQYGHAL